MLVYIHNKKKRRKIVEYSIISNHNTRNFQFISLFGQIRAEKLQFPLFKMIWLRRLYIPKSIKSWIKRK